MFLFCSFWVDCGVKQEHSVRKFLNDCIAVCVTAVFMSKVEIIFIERKDRSHE